MDESDNLPARRGERQPVSKGEQGLATDPLPRGLDLLAPGTNRLQTICLALAVALVLSDSSIVVLALPDILARFSLTIGQVSWVLTGFNIVLAVVAVPVAHLVRRRAPGVLLMLGLAVFAAASLTCALAPSFEVLLLSRGVQAIGGAIAVTAALEILPITTGSERRAAVIWATAGALGAAFGPALGGLLTQLISWEAIFFIQVPAILLAIPTLRVKTHAKREPAGRPHLAANLADSHELPKKKSVEMLTDLVGLLTKHLKKGDKIRIGGLGILQVRKRAARMGRNPATGEAIKIKASKKVAFRAAKELKEAV